MNPSSPFAEKYGFQRLGFELVPVDMKDALEKFYGEAGQIVHSFLRTLESQEPPPVIYHYTNDVGLRGILETGQLWLTDIFSLNDPSELSHGFSHAIKIMNEKAINGPPESKTFAKNFAAYPLAEIQESMPFCMCSFSSCGDDLGQWRAYADNGRGYALGFDAKALEAGFTRDGATQIPNRSTFPVTYEDAKVARIHCQIVEKMFGLISLPRERNLQDAARRPYMEVLQILLTVRTLEAALYFKHGAYANEKEYRFLHGCMANAPPAVKLRTRPYSLVKYKEFDWRKGVAAETLKRIVVGPAADQKAAQFAQDCLSSFYPGAVEITHSEIPYRAE
jgi:hypothetical protein